MSYAVLCLTDRGTFLVVAGDRCSGWTGTGNYLLTFFFFNDTATTEIYTLSLHDALPISYLATIGTGDIDAWTFTANAGESIVVRMGETSAGSALTPELRLYGDRESIRLYSSN